MKATGIVRKIDDLGRIVIPKEVRRTLGLEANSPAEMYLSDGASGVVIEKATGSASSVGVVRNVDDLGRLVVPMEMRVVLNIRAKDSLEVFIDGNKIILRRYCPGCIFNGDMDDTIEYRGYNVSRKAIKELAKKAGII